MTSTYKGTSIQELSSHQVDNVAVLTTVNIMHPSSKPLCRTRASLVYRRKQTVASAILVKICVTALPRSPTGHEMLENKFWSCITNLNFKTVSNRTESGFVYSEVLSHKR
jgi:hypothetical protein